jgi:hypothetical protein
VTSGVRLGLPVSDTVSDSCAFDGVSASTVSDTASGI